MYRVLIKYCVFSKKLPHLAAIGRTKYYQPIGVAVHSHCVESFEGFLQRCRRGRGCSELWKKIIFSWTPCNSAGTETLLRCIYISEDNKPNGCPSFFLIWRRCSIHLKFKCNFIFLFSPYSYTTLEMFIFHNPDSQYQMHSTDLNLVYKHTIQFSYLAS